jgi:hypothetical protein
MTPLGLLIEDLEEVLYSMGEVYLHEFSWHLRGDGGMTDEDEILALCEQAHAVLTTRFALHLEWRDWPPGKGPRAPPGTPLDFDTHRDFETTQLRVPFLALVPNDYDAVAAELAPGFQPLPEPRRRGWWRWLRR